MESIPNILGARAHDNPAGRAFTFLQDGELETATATFEQLDRRARGVAAVLRERREPEGAVVVVCPAGIDYIVAVLGCFYAGRPAVPAYVPSSPRRGDRLARILADSGARTVLTVGAVRQRLHGLDDRPEIAAYEVDAIPGADVDVLLPPADAPALIQYTSGTTGPARAVLLTHANLIANQQMIADVFGVRDGSTIVGWLPLHHDMGLIGNVLHAVFAGAHAVLMAPSAFLQKPVRWLAAVSRYAAETSGGPNFAYDHCVARITEEQKAGLDLRAWRTAFNGAEYVCADTLRSFAAAFGGCGFRARAFRPCYGLAEAVLLVAGHAGDRDVTCLDVDREALRDGRLAPPGSQAASMTLVACGRPVKPQQVAIVDPATCQPCPDDRVGEIWIAGPNVGRAYRDDGSGQFDGRPRGVADGPFLKTGDLGFVRDGELFVAGRAKDVVVVRGTNHYAEDLEFSIRRSHPHLLTLPCAALSADGGGEEYLAVLQEVRTPSREAHAEIADAIRAAVTADHGIQPGLILLVRPGALPRTSSGKVRRSTCRTMLLGSAFESHSVHCCRLPRTAAHEPSGPPPREVGVALLGAAAAALQIRPEQLDPRRSLVAQGLDSLSAATLRDAVEVQCGVAVPIADLLEGLSLSDLQQRIGANLYTATVEDDRVAAEALSEGERALWFLQRVNPRSAAYNLSWAASIDGELDVAALRRALQRLVDRHAALRTSFPSRDGEPIRHVADRAALSFSLVDVTIRSDVERQLARAIQRPFDVETGPLFRASLVRAEPAARTLLIEAHHLVADFRSMQILFDDLHRLLLDERGRAGSVPAAPASQYSRHVSRQRALLASLEGERLRQFWHASLGGELPSLTFRVRRPAAAARQLCIPFHLAPSVADALRTVAAGASTTLFTVLVAAAQIWLARLTQSRDVVLGIATSGRARADLDAEVGCFVNPIAIRSEIDASGSFATHLDRVRRRTLEALAHQAYPFAKVVESVQPVRSAERHPIFQTLLAYQPSRFDGDPLPYLALGLGGRVFTLGGMTLTSHALVERQSPFDIALMATDGAHGLDGVLQCNPTLFDRPLAERFARAFEVLLDAIAQDATRCVGDLPLVSADERARLIESSNCTARPYDRTRSIVDLFEARAQATPDRVAIVDGGAYVTYGALRDRSRALAEHLGALGAAPETIVAVCMSPTSLLVESLLGVLASGAAYLPLDPAYPRERIEFMLADSAAAIVLTDRRRRATLSGFGGLTLDVDELLRGVRGRRTHGGDASACVPSNTAYLIYTSGSTGTPKGVQVTHGNVANLFGGLDAQVSLREDDVVLASTSVSFDISVLEIFWTLSRGATLLLASPAGAVSSRRGVAQEAGFSVFYFAADDGTSGSEKYRLLLDGARFADAHGFEAVWTPERHFHGFGGIYPNPSVTGAALATITDRLDIRAGSVVLPLHQPIRVAEEWSVVDNLSNGRVGIAFASGWHADDFVLAPGNYQARRDVMRQGIEQVRALWRGEPLRATGGTGTELDIRIFPRPVQAELPTWVTSAGAADTFRLAGEIGANVLTHLLGQSFEALESNIALYRRVRAERGHDPASGRVTVMLHTLVLDDLEAARRHSAEPFKQYLRRSLGLVENLVRSLSMDLEVGRLDARDTEDLLDFLFAKYFEVQSLLGSVGTCREVVARLREIGVGELACLIDFGVATPVALAGLECLARLRDATVASAAPLPAVLHGPSPWAAPSLVQMTPSMLRLLLTNPAAAASLDAVRTLLVGGEALDPSLVADVRRRYRGRLLNMYGPTETTVWSTSAEIDGAGVPIGRPLANTRVYVLDDDLEPVAVGVEGSLYIGGDGVARAYWNRPDATAERFRPDRFATRPGDRMYATGDRVHVREDGQLEFVGRRDGQVKIRGHRVELPAISVAVLEIQGVREAATVFAPGDASGGDELVTYVTLAPGAPEPESIRESLARRLPAHEVPAAIVQLDALPLTPNGKLNRAALPSRRRAGRSARRPSTAPRTEIERQVARIWADALHLEQVGIDDRFFEIGGHSMLLVQVHHQLQRTLPAARALPLIVLLERPTIRSLAAYLAVEESSPGGDAQVSERVSRQRRAQLQRSQHVREQRAVQTL